MKVNEELNNILQASYAEAKAREHEYLTPEHILFASLFFEEAKEIIIRCGANIESIKKKIEEFFQVKMTRCPENKAPMHSFSFQSVMDRAVYHTLTSQKDWKKTDLQANGPLPYYRGFETLGPPRKGKPPKDIVKICQP